MKTEANIQAALAQAGTAASAIDKPIAGLRASRLRYQAIASGVTGTSH